MTASLDNAAANLRMVVFMFVSHNLVNSMLLSAWNPVRCVFWYVDAAHSVHFVLCANSLEATGVMFNTGTVQNVL